MLAAALLAGAAAAGGEENPAGPEPATRAGAPSPRLTDLRCLEPCAGSRKGAVGSDLKLTGHHLRRVTEVRFKGDPARVSAIPDAASRRRILVAIPAGATSGRLRVVTADADSDRSPMALRVVPADRLPAPGSFELRRSSVRPRSTFIDGAPVRLRYRFRADRPTGVRIEVIRLPSKKVMRTWRRPHQAPYSGHKLRWNGLRRGGNPVADGSYRFRVGAFENSARGAGRVRLHGFKFPVRGGHGYGGAGQRFGAPRSGGRTHQGQDVYAACGTRLEAARGGRVQVRGYSASLYGHFVVIDGFKTDADYMYSHMRSHSRFGNGDRVHTGRRIGAVGKSGNARTTPCHLHFEIWPHGWRRGSPVDPLPALRRWDGWS
jgi:murein DD-endopeptidase MepM/ murein hydrolase activator NlpD